MSNLYWNATTSTLLLLQVNHPQLASVSRMLESVHTCDAHTSAILLF